MNEKKNNDPTLFVNSVHATARGLENQESFDSRRVKKNSRVGHRLDDLYAMLIYKKNIQVEVTVDKMFYRGLALALDDNYLTIQTNSGIERFDIRKITELVIR